MEERAAYYTDPVTEPAAWERQPGETNLWFDRFVRFCLLGVRRSLDQVYRDELAANGREKPRTDGKARRAPGAWRQKAKAFDWLGRAEAWDKERRRRALESVQEALDLARSAAPEAMQFQIDLMNGKVVPAEHVEIIHRRLASNSILNRAGVVLDGLQAEEDDGAVQVVGIRINRGERQD